MTVVLDRRTNPAAEPGQVVDQHDARAVNRKVDRDHYASRQKIYAKLGHGTFRNLKWVVMALTLGVYYLVPWLRWSRGADLPNQAVLLDMEHNRFFFFFLEIWPQEFYFVTGLLVLAAISLFLLTSIAGRVWCGYTCPQTVWTDLMITIERFWQGDRNARIRLDKAPWSLSKLFRKVMTHLSWAAIGVATGGALVFYFRDAPTLAAELVTGNAPMVAYLFIGIFAGTTYLLGGIAREQVCTYMCPWPRIQGAMTDHHTLLVSYKQTRGEPRGPHKKGDPWEGRGDCIDCNACVAVCPAGIDIRDGSQLECIQCALCIDACNDIMTKVGRPRGLIGYDTVAIQKAASEGLTEKVQVIRPRTLLYAGLLSIVSAIMLFGWFNRTVLEINVLHDRSPQFVLLSDGSIRNGFTVKILNKQHEPRTVALSVAGLPGAQLTTVGTSGEGNVRVTVKTDDLREVRVYVTVPADQTAKLTAPVTQMRLIAHDITSNTEIARKTFFQSPEGNARIDQ